MSRLIKVSDSFDKEIREFKKYLEQKHQREIHITETTDQVAKMLKRLHRNNK